MTKTIKLTISEYLDLVKVIRMLYGVATATIFFEKNFTEFTGMDLNALQRMAKRANINATREDNS